MEHKKDYVSNLYEPMKDLGQDLAQLFADKPGNLIKVSRIYRDARLHHPLPYKESLWICIRRDVQWWSENPCLYFEIRPEGVSYGFFFWQPKVATLKAFREEIARDPKTFLQLVRKTEKDTGIPITAELYKRPPQPSPKKELEPYFAWKRGISCVKSVETGPEMLGPELGVQAKATIEKLIPLYEYFCRFCG